jgi:glycosyltransferase involved in cell wall biosynthesis
MKNRIAIVFFGPISHSKQLLHLSNLHNEIVQEFAKQGNLTNVFCKDYTPITGVSNVTFEQYSGTFFSYAATITYELLSFLPGFTNRLIHEFFFDLFVKNRINYQNIDTILILRASNLGLCRESKKRQINVLGITGIYPMSYIANIINKEAEKINISEKSEYTSKKRIKMFNSIIDTWDKVISLSASPITKDILKASPFGYKAVITTTEHDVDKSIFYPSKSITQNKKIAFLAIVDDTLKKGIHILLDAWEKAQPKIYDRATLTIAGNIKKNTSSILKKHDLKNVHLIGYSNQIENHFRASDVFIASSIIDLGPRAIKQAMRCGIPVISSNNCGMSTFIEHGKHGFIYSDNNSDELSELIITAAENPSLLKDYGKNCLEKANIFDNQLYASEVYSIVKKYCENNIQPALNNNHSIIK